MYLKYNIAQFLCTKKNQYILIEDALDDRAFEDLF